MLVKKIIKQEKKEKLTERSSPHRCCPGILEPQRNSLPSLMPAVIVMLIVLSIYFVYITCYLPVAGLPLSSAGIVCCILPIDPLLFVNIDDELRFF